MKKLKSKKGQSLTEYIILLALIVVASIGIVEVLGNSIRHKLAVITEKVQGESGSKINKVDEVSEKHYRTRNLKDFWKTNE